MIEIPESMTIAKQLNEMITGKIVKIVISQSSEHKFAFYSGSHEDCAALLIGRKVVSAIAYAGHIEISFNGINVLLAEDINIRYFQSGESIPEKHQLYICFEDDSALVCTIKLYGLINVYKEGKNDNQYYIVAKEKPSPLSLEFDENYFGNIINKSKPTLSLKALLASEQRIPGLGNGSLQDILYNAHMHPKTKIINLKDKDKENIFQSIKRTIFNMTEKNGRNTERDLFGNPGGYKTILSAKTFKSPCPSCGGTIVKQNYMGGNIYFCPICQPLKIED